MYQSQSRKRQQLIALLGTLCLLLTSCLASSQEEEIRQAQFRQGENIFVGKESLPAKIAGHQEALPPQAARCINCHVPAQSRAGKTESAPAFSNAWLQQVRVRRGGPAFAYGRESFCTTLRSGIDPEYVILSRTMPRFDISNEQCLSLWLYLTEKHGNEQ